MHFPSNNLKFLEVWNLLRILKVVVSDYILNSFPKIRQTDYAMHKQGFLNKWISNKIKTKQNYLLDLKLILKIFISMNDTDNQ